MCLRAHVSFALADVPGPTPAARTDRFSLAADHKNLSFYTETKERKRTVYMQIFVLVDEQ